MKESKMDKIVIWVLGYGMCAGAWCFGALGAFHGMMVSFEKRGISVQKPLFHTGEVMICISFGLGLLVGRRVRKSKSLAKSVLIGLVVGLAFCVGGVVLTILAIW